MEEGREDDEGNVNHPRERMIEHISQRLESSWERKRMLPWLYLMPLDLN